MSTQCQQKNIYLFAFCASAAFIKYDNISIGNGNTIVEFFSADIVLSVCKDRTKIKEGIQIKSNTAIGA